MACKLGCDPSYELLVTSRCGRNTLASLTDFTQLKWGRVLDDISEARVTLPGDCCGGLANVRAWANELHVIRDGDEVWSGPIVLQPNCRSNVTIIANDFLAWLGRRVIRILRCYDPECGGTPLDGVSIAEQLVRDGLAPDDPCLLDFLTVITDDFPDLQERNYAVNSAYVIDALRDLARGALDFTAIGRRIILMPEGHPLGKTALLTCDSFGGDVCATEDGFATVTRAVVTGKLADNTTVVSGSAGGVDPYLGLIEVLHNDDSIRTEFAANNQAAGIVRSGNPTPLLVQPPQGSALAPEAPVCISQLVPGVVVPVVMDCVCRDVSQDLRLIKLDVTVDVNGESVNPTLVPSGVGTGV